VQILGIYSRQNVGIVGNMDILQNTMMWWFCCGEDECEGKNAANAGFAVHVKVFTVHQKLNFEHRVFAILQQVAHRPSNAC
jgi:hypothetical protein